MKQEANYYKSLIGTQVIDLDMNRKKIIRSIAFYSKDWKICLFSFKWGKGEYLLDINQLSIIKSQQLTFIGLAKLSVSMCVGKIAPNLCCAYVAINL